MNVSSAVREPVDQPCGRCIDCGCADHQVLTAGERGLQHLWLDADGDILGRGAAIDLKVYTAV